MSSLKDQYVSAIAALLQEGKDVSAVSNGLRETMARRGHSRLLPAVLKASLEAVARLKRDTVPRLTVARRSDVESYRDMSKEAEVAIDASLIGGFIYRQGFTETDNSYKSKLLRWYRAISR